MQDLNSPFCGMYTLDEFARLFRGLVYCSRIKKNTNCTRNQCDQREPKVDVVNHIWKFSIIHHINIKENK